MTRYQRTRYDLTALRFPLGLKLKDELNFLVYGFKVSHYFLHCIAEN